MMTPYMRDASIAIGLMPISYIVLSRHVGVMQIQTEHFRLMTLVQFTYAHTQFEHGQ